MRLEWSPGGPDGNPGGRNGSKSVDERPEQRQRQDPDAAAVGAFQRGQSGAFDLLVQRHQSRVYRLACRILGDPEAAEDAAQEAFVRAWRALPGFKGEARFSTWLTRIAINQCRNELRRRRTPKHARALSLDAPLRANGESAGDGLAAAGPAPWEQADGRDLALALRAALARLEPEAREVLVLREAEALSYEEIAEILAVPVGTVRSRLHRARAELQQRLTRAADRTP